MEKQIMRRRSSLNGFVQIDTGNCKACWKCLAECDNNVIGKVDLPWHKHAIFVNTADCSGCLSCISACEYGALKKIENEMQDRNSSRKMISPFFVNTGLLIFGPAMVFSGSLLQFKYHMSHESEASSFLGMNYFNWSDIHKISIVSLTVLMIFHIVLHFKWYKTVLAKKLFARNKLLTALSILFMLVAATGYVPWIISVMKGKELIWYIFIEIHDKLTIFFSILLTIHIAMKFKWYFKFFDKGKNENIRE